jgi:hypothetical protein
MEFRKRDKTVIPETAQYVIDYIKNVDGQAALIVGCDSLPPTGKYTILVGVIAIYRLGKGAHIIFRKKRIPRTKAVIDRLWAEVEYAVEIAKYLDKSDVLTSVTNLESFQINVQLDLNADKQFQSNIIHDAALGYVKSLGFDCSTKPFAWAATYAADMICRNKF